MTAADLPNETHTPMAPPPTPPGAARRGVRNVIEWVVIVGVALLAALVIKTFLLQAFYIPSESMVPALKVSDRVLVNKLSYHLHPVHQGDIVVFKRPPNEALGGGVQIKDLIKRVVALPGQTVEGRDGHVYVDGRLQRPTYVGEVERLPFAPVTVPAHHYWVMGDNRNNSRDSRFFGTIDRSLIVGRAFIRVWPVGSISFL